MKSTQRQETVSAPPPPLSDGEAPAASAKEKFASAWGSVREMRPRRSHLVADLIAALTFAAVNIPQGLAYALMAGVNPVFGLYTLMIATPVGALATSAVYMNVSPTSALAASTGDVLRTYSTDSRASALVTLVLLMGIFQFLLGIFKLGFIMQFVPNSVMVGFTSGVAVLIVLGQLGNFTGYYSGLSNKVVQTADLVVHHNLIIPQCVIVGFATIGLILLLERSRFEVVRNMALFIAMAVASAIPLLLSWSMVQTVSNVADIPQTLPKFVLPDLSLVPGLALSAAALGLLGLVQGASVAQLFPNPDGKFSKNSQDFLGQGLANLATCFFQGIPAGGSTSSTAIVVKAGAQTRWANIFGGILVLLIVLLVGDWVELVAMPALAGLLIVVGIRMLNFKSILSVWQTGAIPRVSAITTFAAALIAPLQVAIVVGVVVAVLLHVFQQAQKVILVELAWSDQVFPEERPVPKALLSNSITTLQVYGSLFFAAAGTFEKLLPVADQANGAVVILLMRGQGEVGSTFINAITRYAQQLSANHGKLMLSGVSEVIYSQLDKTGTLKTIGKENIFPAEVRVGESMQKAYSSALLWIGGEGPQHPSWLDIPDAVTGDSARAEATSEVITQAKSDATEELTTQDESQIIEPTIEPPIHSDRLLYLEELERLAELKDKGVVTEEEFTEKKHQILGI